MKPIKELDKYLVILQSQVLSPKYYIVFETKQQNYIPILELNSGTTIKKITFFVRISKLCVLNTPQAKF